MMVTMPICGKTFIILPLQSQGPMILKFNMLNMKPLFYKQYLNDGPGLTLTYYTARSNWVAYMHFDGVIFNKGYICIYTSDR